MERRPLGTSDLLITPIGVGTWAIGGSDWIFGWGPQSDSESLATIRRAVDAGVNWIDTAAGYGLGHAERIVARALRDIPLRERPYVFTNCGLVWDDLGNVSRSFEPASIRRQAEASLRRLEIECFDLYQLGWPVFPNTLSGKPAALDDAWDTMAALQREGKARFIGLANCGVHQLSRLRHAAAVTSVQVPYSLLDREIESRALPFCERHRIGVIAHSSLHRGLLAGALNADGIEALPHNDWRRSSPYFQEPRLGRTLALVDRLRAAGARSGQTAGQVAIAWTLRKRAVAAASIGFRRPEQVIEIVGAASLQLSAEEMQALDAIEVNDPRDANAAT